MQRKMTPRALLFLATVLVTACASEQPEVDRVQTNLVEKAIFEGEWWFSSTIIDATYDASYVATLAGASSPFSGSMSADLGVDYNRLGAYAFTPVGSLPIGRIRWVIDEDFLYAFRTYELTSGGNEDGRSSDFRGQPLAVFAIEDHVDIQQDYNAVTGEESNVRSENTEDQRWYERQFMRVDWSENLITEFASNSAQDNQLFDSFKRTSTSFFVQDETHEELPEDYRPQFVRVSEDPDYRFAGEWDGLEPGDDPVHYMSFVTREAWDPGPSCGLCSSIGTTTRHAFLRVPPQHEYAVETATNREYERFGIIRARQPTYIRGGEDTSIHRVHCETDADCGVGGYCDTERSICSGGLTADRGETDFLSFRMSRHSLYSSSLTDQTCVSDWECNGRFDSCDDASDEEMCQEGLAEREGSRCDPVAQRCTIPIRNRPTRAVQFTLTKHFPPYLVRRAFEAVGQWNAALMRGQRAVTGRLATDQFSCDKDDDDCDCPDGEICTSDLKRTARVECQDEDPTKYCHCDSPEATRGLCPDRYDPFESPEQARERGVPNPYECYVEGPADVEAPTAYTDYDQESSYEYRFVGEECLLTLASNRCDLDTSASCQELGDIRFQFLNWIDRGAVSFGGVSIPLSDPHSGELIVANAAVTAETFESVATTASQFLPVLNGDSSEDAYFSGENVRGYFARLGRVEHPIPAVPASGDGTEITDPSRPLGNETDLLEDLAARFERVMPKAERLRGQDGRAAVLSGRAARLRKTPVGASVAATLSDAVQEVRDMSSPVSPLGPGASGNQIEFERPLDQVMADRKRLSAMSANFYDVVRPALFESQYWGYWADRFADRSSKEASIRLQQAVFTAIMAHEVGHSLGLEHNFAGSLDRNNYHDAYFKLARQVPLPWYREFDQAEFGGDEDDLVHGAEALRYGEALKEAREQRQEAGAGNVMSSSVMDYPGDLSDLAGVGHYDRAAVLFSYFNTVEAFETGDPTVDPESDGDQRASLFRLTWSDTYRRELWSYYRGGQACNESADCPFSTGKAMAVYQPLTQRCVTNPRDLGQAGACDGQDNCVCSNYLDDFQAYQAGTAYRSQFDSPEWAPVEYLYCDDSRANDLSWCTRNDAGESFQEVVQNYRTRWNYRYPREYFRNFRQAGPRMGYSRMMVPDAVKIYQHLFFRANFEAGFSRTFRRPEPLLFGDQVLASVDAFNWLTELLSAPDVGTYALDEDANVYRQISGDLDAPGGDFSLAPGQGYYMWSEYEDGLNGFGRRLARAGTFVDKVLALDAISERDWALNFTIDERYFVNFYDYFAEEVTDVIGGMLMRNPRQYAPRVTFDDDGEPVLHYLSSYRDVDLSTGQSNRGGNDETFPDPAVDGVDSEALRDLALYVALANFPVYFDTSFEQRLLVFKLGGGDGYKIPEARADGTPICGFGEDGCDAPDYIVYESDRLHTTYVAVTIDPNGSTNADEQQLGYKLLLSLHERQNEIRELSARITELEGTDQPSDVEQEELSELVDERSKLRIEQDRDEGFAEYLIELGRTLGISTIFL